MITVILFAIFAASAFGAEKSLEYQIARKYLNVTKDAINNRKESSYLNGLTNDASVRTCHKDLHYQDLTGKIENSSKVLIYDDKITHVKLEKDNGITAKFYTVKIQTDGQILLAQNLIKLRMDNQLPQFKSKHIRQDCDVPAHEVLLRIYKEEHNRKAVKVETIKPTTHSTVGTSTTKTTTTTHFRPPYKTYYPTGSEDEKINEDELKIL